MLTRAFFFFCAPKCLVQGFISLSIQAPARACDVIAVLVPLAPFLGTCLMFPYWKVSRKAMDRELQGVLATSGSQIARLFSYRSLSIYLSNNLYVYLLQLPPL